MLSYNNNGKKYEIFREFGKKNPKIYDENMEDVSKEYSIEWQEGMEPYYPINDEDNTKLYEKYKELAQKNKNIIFGGRLAEYKYYDMAPVIEKALNIADITLR